MNSENIFDAKEIFVDLEGMQYCLLRNYEFLLNDAAAESLDTAVAEKDIEKFAGILRKHGFTERKPHFSKKHRAFFRVVGYGKKISFDVQVGGVYWNDMRYMGEDIFENKVKKDFFYTLSDEDTCMMLIAHSILGKRMFKEKYQRIIGKLMPAHKEYVRQAIASIFSPKIAQQIIDHAEKRTLSTIKTYPLVAYFLVKKPQQLFGFAALFVRWVKWKKPLASAPLISIVGPDGAGKTSLADALRDCLKNTKRKAEIIYTGRGRGHLLPISRLGYRYKKNEQKNEKIQKQAGKKEKIKIPYILALPVFALDLWLRYVFFIFPRRLRKTVVITDRYCTDILLMKHVPMWMKKVAVFFFPRPLFSVLLYNDAEVLHQRRSEESVEELRRQMDILMQRPYTLRVMTMDREKDTARIIDVLVTELLRTWW